MSKRSLRDYIHDAFFAKDKATLAKIVLDAESEVDHGEPDGDEGKHASNVHVHIEHSGAAKGSEGNGDNGNGDDKTDDSGKLVDRVAKLETGMKSMDSKLDKVLDSIKSSKDGDLPPWLAKKDGDDDKGDDDKGDDKDKTDDDLPTDNTTGAQIAQTPPSVEPELMEADPALKTGPSKMGDSAYLGRISTAFANLVQDTKARAEILSPGIKFATFDAKQGPHVAGVAICNLRRSALTKAVSDPRTGPAIAGYFTADSVKTMSCDAVRLAFLDASDRVRAVNNAKGRPSESVYAGDGDPRAMRDGVTQQIRAINAKNHEFWAKHGGLGPQGSVH